MQPKWTQYSVSIPIGSSKKAVNLFQKAFDHNVIELDHNMTYGLFYTYRKYRRGKNRCKHCGVKLDMEGLSNA